MPSITLPAQLRAVAGLRTTLDVTARARIAISCLFTVEVTGGILTAVHNARLRVDAFDITDGIIPTGEPHILTVAVDADVALRIVGAREFAQCAPGALKAAIATCRAITGSRA
jgi:hypothetical protein